MLTKLYPTRSHTGAAQGGICAALGNLEEDHWEWHMYDTVKGGDYLVDQDAAEILAREAIETVIELEHMGLPFNRTADGKIDQRRFGGHTRNFGEAPVRRACYAADRTGHMILQTLYQQCIKHGVEFFDEYHVVDLLIDGLATTLAAWSRYRIADGELHVFRAAAVMFATGGFGRMFKITSNAFALTGDGVALATGAACRSRTWSSTSSTRPGIVGIGILLSEAARGEGGILRNDAGERFMERYAPTLLDLAPRDMVSRAIYTEIRAGRGIGGKDYVHLDLTHLGKKVIDEKLPDITEFVARLPGHRADHPADTHPADGALRDGRHPDQRRVARRRCDEQNTVVPGLYAAGECACVSVSTAPIGWAPTRWSTSSSSGAAPGGRWPTTSCRGGELPALPAGAAEPVRAEIERTADAPARRERTAHPGRAGRR